MTTTTAKPDPKPNSKQSLRVRAGKAQLETAKAALAQKKADDAAVLRAAKLTPEKKADLAEQALREIATPEAIATITAADTTDLGGEKSKLDEKVKQASAAALARRVANEADKVTLKAKRADDAAARDTARAELTAAMVARYNETKSVDAVCKTFPNPETGKPRWPQPVKAILAKAGCDVSTSTRSKFDRDTIDAERRVEIECAITTITAAAAENGISVATLVKAFAATA